MKKLKKKTIEIRYLGIMLQKLSLGCVNELINILTFPGKKNKSKYQTDEGRE